jgi:hypothetical protein
MTSTKPLPLPSQQYMEDRRWIQRNIDALVQDHANAWIAVHRGTVLAGGTDLGAVAAEARRQTPDDDVVFQFIDDGTLVFFRGTASHPILS